MKGSENKEYKLIKALYGLKQASRAWYDRIYEYFRNQSLVKSFTKPTLYVKRSNNLVMMVVSMYVDDLLIKGPDTKYLNEFKGKMMTEFKMIDLGFMTYFLGMEIQ